jgi:site-specific DNA-methyltransferase (adenine-specific)
MACEQNGRVGYTMEYDPRYVDAIVQRWENFTGKKAVLLND